MGNVTELQVNRTSVSFKRFQSHFSWTFLLSGIILVSLVSGVWMIRQGPDAGLIAWLIFIGGIIAIIYKPRWSIYLIAFFALLGDSVLVYWYPFTKNFSSAESIFYLSDSLIFSPLEVYLLLGVFSWLIRFLINKKGRFYTGELTIPALVFSVFIAFGLIYGVASGGNLTIALWEVRPFFYLLVIVVLSSNLFTQKAHYQIFFWWAVTAIIIKSIIGTYYIYTVMAGHLSSVNGITEHPAAIQIDSIFLLILVAWMYRASPMKRFGLLIPIPFMALTYIASQRRSAIISLAFAVVILLMLLYFENRRLLIVILPPMAIVAAIYLAAFWNSSGSLGLPAQAIKSVVSPNAVSTRNQSSDIYRLLENYDTGYTIQQKPLTGVGFGNKFFVPIPLPDISFFVWWNYFPHNSIIYLWVKAGVGGFLALFYFIGICIMNGVRIIRRTRDRETKVLLITGLLYIFMHFLFAYVDISWDARSMVYLGAIIGMFNTAERVLSITTKPPKKRFPWQPDPIPESGLLQ